MHFQILKFLDFHVKQNVNSVNGSNDSNFDILPRPDSPSFYFEEDVDGEYLVFSESFIAHVNESLKQHQFLTGSMVETVVQLMDLVSIKKEQNSWDNMVEEINSNYQKIMK